MVTATLFVVPVACARRHSEQLCVACRLLERGRLRVSRVPGLQAGGVQRLAGDAGGAGGTDGACAAPPAPVAFSPTVAVLSCWLPTDCPVLSREPPGGASAVGCQFEVRGPQRTAMLGFGGLPSGAHGSCMRAPTCLCRMGYSSLCIEVRHFCRQLDIHSFDYCKRPARRVPRRGAGTRPPGRPNTNKALGRMSMAVAMLACRLRSCGLACLPAGTPPASAHPRIPTSGFWGLAAASAGSMAEACRQRQTTLQYCKARVGTPFCACALSLGQAIVYVPARYALFGVNQNYYYV